MGGWMESEEDEDFGECYFCGSPDHYIRDCPHVGNTPDCGSVALIFLVGFVLGVGLTYVMG